MDKESETRLVKLAKSGDRNAFGSLMEMHQERLFRVACRLTGRTDIAEAVTQDTFVQAYRSMRQFQERSSFMTWLYSIAVSKAADRHREARRARAVLPLDGGSPIHTDARRSTARGPMEELEDKELAALLDNAIMELPAEQRAALVLVIQEGLSYRDAADALGCPEGTVAWRVWNARRLLRDNLQGRI